MHEIAVLFVLSLLLPNALAQTYSIPVAYYSDSACTTSTSSTTYLWAISTCTATSLSTAEAAAAKITSCSSDSSASMSYYTNSDCSDTTPISVTVTSGTCTAIVANSLYVKGSCSGVSSSPSPTTPSPSPVATSSSYTSYGSSVYVYSSSDYIYAYLAAILAALAANTDSTLDTSASCPTAYQTAINASGVCLKSVFASQVQTVKVKGNKTKQVIKKGSIDKTKFCACFNAYVSVNQTACGNAATYCKNELAAMIKKQKLSATTYNCSCTTMNKNATNTAARGVETNVILLAVSIVLTSLFGV